MLELIEKLCKEVRVDAFYHGGLESDVESIKANGLILGSATGKKRFSNVGIFFTTNFGSAAAYSLRYHTQQNRLDAVSDRIVVYKVPASQVTEFFLDPDYLAFLEDLIEADEEYLKELELQLEANHGSLESVQGSAVFWFGKHLANKTPAFMELVELFKAGADDKSIPQSLLEKVMRIMPIAFYAKDGCFRPTEIYRIQLREAIDGSEMDLFEAFQKLEVETVK